MGKRSGPILLFSQLFRQGHAQAMLWLLHHPGHHLHHCCHQARTKHQAFVVLEERRANLTEATSAKSATKALLTAFFTHVGTCVSATSALYSSGRAGEEESAPCVVRLFKTSSKPTDRNCSFQNVDRKFYTVITS